VQVLGSRQSRDVVWIRDEASPYVSPADQFGDLRLADHSDAGANVEHDRRKPAFWNYAGTPRQFDRKRQPPSTKATTARR
jgi:hypothetical protein